MSQQRSHSPGNQQPAITHNPHLTITILLIGVAIMLVGNGAFGTVLGVRANLLGFDVFVTGLVMSAYFVGYILGAYYCLKAVLEVGHIRVFAALAALASATALLHPLLPTPLAWGFLRVVAGFCLVGFYIIVESWLNSQATPENRGKVFAIYMTVNLTALAAGQYLLAIDDPTGFVVFSIIAILFALALIPLSLSEVSPPALHIVPTLPIRRLYEISPVGVVTCFATGVIGAALFSMTPVFCSKVRFGIQRDRLIDERHHHWRFGVSISIRILFRQPRPPRGHRMGRFGGSRNRLFFGVRFPPAGNHTDCCGFSLWRFLLSPCRDRDCACE